MEPAMKKMTGLKTFGAAIALAASLPLMTPTASFAAGEGWGPCTTPGGTAVGADGPALSGGQLMAGVGQCRRIADGWQGPYYGYRDYGYRHYGYRHYGYRGWDGGPVGWALGTAAGVTGAVTGFALGRPYYGYYGPDYYTGYDSPRYYENY
jgi:hypothetical protein